MARLPSRSDVAELPVKSTNIQTDGGVAQLGERVLRMYEVRSSIPLSSTMYPKEVGTRVARVLRSKTTEMQFHVTNARKWLSGVIFYVLEKLVL